MIYTFVGDFNDIQTEVRKIIPKTEESVQIFDPKLKPTDINDVVEACETIPMFSEHQYIVVRSADKIFKKLNDKESGRFLEYLKKSDSSTTLIIQLEGMDGRKKIFKELKKRSECKVIKPRPLPSAWKLVNVVESGNLKESLKILQKMFREGIQGRDKKLIIDETAIALNLFGAINWSFHQKFKKIPSRIAFKKHRILREADLDLKSGLPKKNVLASFLIQFVSL